MSRTFAAFSPLQPLAVTAGLLKPIANWIRSANDRRKLADMPDYLLRDIGLRRDQLTAALDGSLIADATEPVPAAPAEVLPFAPAKAVKKPAAPEKPMAA